MKHQPIGRDFTFTAAKAPFDAALVAQAEQSHFALATEALETLTVISGTLRALSVVAGVLRYFLRAAAFATSAITFCTDGIGVFIENFALLASTPKRCAR